MFKKGFTLIELLVVIAVIAVLATAVLSSINPIEQINKAKDTASKSDASEFLGAAERYFATFECYPWDAGNNTPVGECPATWGILGISKLGSMTTTLTELESKNELKTQFSDRIASQANSAADDPNVLMVSMDNDKLVHVCFAPSSKTWLAKAKFDHEGGTTGTGFVCVP